VDAVRLCKVLADVERRFAKLKDIFDMRSIYHHAKERVPGAAPAPHPSTQLRTRGAAGRLSRRRPKAKP